MRGVRYRDYVGYMLCGTEIRADTCCAELRSGDAKETRASWSSHTCVSRPYSLPVQHVTTVNSLPVQRVTTERVPRPYSLFRGRFVRGKGSPGKRALDAEVESHVAVPCSRTHARGQRLRVLWFRVQGFRSGADD
eukprot:2422643-Rhodomonas_salina.1